MADANDQTREVLALLKELLQEQMESRRQLDKKAWDILTFTTGSISLAVSIQTALIGKTPPIPFILVLVALIILYAILVYFVGHAIKPRDWGHVPGDATSLSAVKENYVFKRVDIYLVNLLGDYAGDDTREPHKPGAIELAQSNNRDKADYINKALVVMALIIINLVVAVITLAIFR